MGNINNGLDMKAKLLKRLRKESKEKYIVNRHTNYEGSEKTKFVVWSYWRGYGMTYSNKDDVYATREMACSVCAKERLKYILTYVRARKSNITKVM